MSNSGDLIRPVCGVLDDLREVLHVRDMRENGGLQADPLEFRRTWKRLKEALLELADVVQKPQPGQGLASVWLRAICEKAAKVEEAAKRYPNGWSDVLFHDGMNVSWLVIDHWQNGYQILTWSRGQQPGLESLLEPKSSPLEKLRRLAEKWTAEFENEALESPQHRMGDTYVRQAGEILLEAVDALLITSEVLENTGFEEQVLRYLDLPSGLVPSFLSEVSGEGLLAFVEQLDALREDDTEDGKPGPKSYSSPRNYARDKWIYTNVHLNDCQTLSEKLKKECRQKHWKYVKSRNALKEAAKRYADFHGLSRRRFPDPRLSS